MKKGYVYKRDGDWAVAIPNPDIRGGYQRRTGFATKSKASEYLNMRKEQIENVQLGIKENGALPCKEFFKEYLNYVWNNYAYETHKTYKGVLKDLLLFLDDKYPHIQKLNELRVKVFEDYKIWLKDTGHKDNTVNNHLKTFKAMFNVAIKWEQIDKNPLTQVGLINVDDEKIIVTLNTPERFNLFFNRCKELKPEYFPHYYCSAKLALRFGEMITLEWDNIDFEHNVVSITRKETFNPKGRSKKDKKAKERIIPFSQDVREIFESLPRKNKRVFLKRGKPISPRDNSFRYWISRIVKKTEIQGMTRFHELRHSTGDILGQSHSIYDIKAFLGHSDIRTTERYVRISDEAKKRMAETLGNFGTTTPPTTP